MSRYFYHLYWEHHIFEYREDGRILIHENGDISIANVKDDHIWGSLETLLRFKDRNPKYIIEIIQKNPECEFVLTNEDFYL